jgi:hypothetical protein
MGSSVLKVGAAVGTGVRADGSGSGSGGIGGCRDDRRGPCHVAIVVKAGESSAIASELCLGIQRRAPSFLQKKVAAWMHVGSVGFAPGVELAFGVLCVVLVSLVGATVEDVGLGATVEDHIMTVSWLQPERPVQSLESSCWVQRRAPAWMHMGMSVSPQTLNVHSEFFT